MQINFEKLAQHQKKITNFEYLFYLHIIAIIVTSSSRV